MAHHSRLALSALLVLAMAAPVVYADPPPNKGKHEGGEHQKKDASKPEKANPEKPERKPDRGGGHGRVLDDRDRPAPLTPVPEPSTLALMAVGLGGLAVGAWRRRSGGR